MRLRRGFTLVELLVVIGIIALLISILLPALNSARKQANTVKCESAMREMFNAVQMYVNDSKGWAPPLRCAGSTAANLYVISYTNFNPPLDTKLTNQHWFTFLAKYVTRTVQGQSSITTSNVGSAGSIQQDAQRGNILWGCPEWTPEVNRSASFPGGTNTNNPGYGYNGWPEYTSAYPAAGKDLGEPGFSNDQDDLAVSGITDTAGNWGNPSLGRWYRWNKYTQASARGLIGDANWYFMDALAVPAGPPAGPLFGQHVLTDKAVWIDGTAGGGANGENQFDAYRHGRFPRMQQLGTQGYYSKIGGKVAYNMLFCDGHVATLNDLQSGIQAIRMRYPG